MDAVHTPVQSSKEKDADLQRRSSPTETLGRKRRSISQQDRDRFLEMLAAGWTVRASAKATGRGHQQYYALRSDDPSFAEAWADAYEQGTQAIEQEAFRRAVEGYDEETYDGVGKLLRRVRRYDSALLQILLKARRPEHYRENSRVELNTSVNIAEIEHRRGITVGDAVAFALERGMSLSGLPADVVLPELERLGRLDVLEDYARPALPAAGETSEGA